MFRHVIFDMDGTLADTAKATIGACADASEHFGFPRLDNARIIHTIGIANPEFYYRLYPDLDRERVYAYGQMVEALEEARIPGMGEGILFSGVKQMLCALKAMGVPLYVASTGSPEHVDVVLRSSGIIGLFSVIACGKPEKIEMVDELIGKGADRSQWAMVGDTAKDLDAARASGIAAIAAGFGYCARETWPHYDTVLHEPQDMLALCGDGEA